jgi:hypothetical protein
MHLDQHVTAERRNGNHGVRRHLRYPFSVPLTVLHLLPDGFRSCHGISVDLSEGGLGAILTDDLRVGEIVKVDLPLPSGSVIMAAIVRHSNHRRAGLEFLGLTLEERQRISASSVPSAGPGGFSSV